MSTHVRSALAVTTLALALASCGGGTPTTEHVELRGEVSVQVAGLPADAAADISVRGPGGAVDLTGSAVLRDLPLGAYTVSARTITAGGAPYLAAVEPASVTLREGALAATVKVRYDLPATGALTLNVAGVPAGLGTTLHLTGPGGFKRDLAGVATQTLVGVAPGDYNLTADPIRFEDFTYPATLQPATVTVRRGRTSVANVSFARDPRLGNLAVRLLGLPEGASGTLELRDANGGTRLVTGSGTVTDLPAGEYTVSPRDVQGGGLTYRAAGTALGVSGGGTATLDVTYEPVTGRLRVAVNSPVPVPPGSVRVAETDVSAGGVLDDLTPDEYGVDALSFSRGGWTYLPQVDAFPVNVRAGVTAGATVTYVQQAASPGIGRDMTPPTVSLDGDETGDYAVLSGEAHDPEGQVTVEVFDGSTTLGQATPDPDGHWSLVWTGRAAGHHDLTVVATDAAGNSARVERAVIVNR